MHTTLEKLNAQYFRAAIKNEPEIVKILREEENLGNLHGQLHSKYRELEAPSETLTSVQDQPIMCVENYDMSIGALEKIFFRAHNLLNDWEKILKLNTRDPRPMIKFIRRNNGERDLIGVEIGVHEGINARNILTMLPIKKLFLVDPYIEYSQDGVFRQGISQHFIKAKKNLRDFRNNVEFIKMASEDAADIVPDNLDFVYVDGNHQYEYVMKDIELYYPKVRVGGVFGGHDFWGQFRGVIRAVEEFEKQIGQVVYTEKADWWVIKK